jgi:Cdc6-like AAA superfamily ATPase
MADTTSTPTTNPFVHARALVPGESIKRFEGERLLNLAQGGHNAVLYAPRRFGKTTLLKQVMQEAGEHDVPGVLVDLSDVLGAGDVAARLEQAFRTLPGGLRRLVSKELGSVGVAGFSVSRRSSPPADPISAIHTLLELPAQIADRNGRRLLVVLDEFQALVSLDGMDGVFRSHIQHHSEVSYLFAGSEPSLLRALFEDRARPLYGQAERLRLGRLDADATHDFIRLCFRETGKDAGETIADLVFVAEGHPQRLMLISHLLWDRVETGRAAKVGDLRSAYDAAMRAVDPELRYLWESLSVNERRVLAALASGFSPYQQEARQLMGLASRSSASRAVASLEGKASIERMDTGERRIVDPLLARWVRRHGGARLQVFIVASGGQFAVTDGPSLAFLRSSHQTIAEAEAEADRIAAGGRGADVMIYDSDDPNDLPDWAVSPVSQAAGSSARPLPSQR